MMNWSKSLWEGQRKGIKGVDLDPKFIKIMDASFSKLNWEKHLSRLTTMCFTLTQGDFHPFNIMWTNIGAVLFDWELVSAGSPGQELGQYMVNIEIGIRRACEKKMVEFYRNTLIERGVPDAECQFDDLWREYICGGAAKWIWVQPICLLFFPEKEKQQWFVNQVFAFMQDHGVNHENVEMPRKA